MTVALDRLLNHRRLDSASNDDPSHNPLPPVDWNAVQRVTSRQSAPQTLMGSLERLSQHKECPMHVLEPILKRLMEFPTEPRRHVFSRCISHVWKSTLEISNPSFSDAAARTTTATTTTTTTTTTTNNNLWWSNQNRQWRISPKVAHQLVQIQNAKDMKDRHPLYYEAYQKTKLLLRCMERCDQASATNTSTANGSGSTNTDTAQLPKPFVHLMVQYHQSLFLIWLAYLMDPTCLSAKEDGKTALHVAMDPLNRCAHRNALDGHPIGMPTLEQLSIPSAATATTPPSTFTREEKYTLSLLNQASPIPLLCHLHPQALKVQSPRIPSPLETLLLGFHRLPRHSCWTLLFPYRQFVTDIVQDVLACTRSEPSLLEHVWYATETTILQDNDDHTTKEDHENKDTQNNPNRGLKLFCLPMLHSTLPEWKDQEEGQRFLLTLSYSLLKENPMVLQESIPKFKDSKYPPHQPPFAPTSLYEQVLHERIHQVQQRKRQLQQRQEELKRRLAMATAQQKDTTNARVSEAVPNNKLPPRKRIRVSSHLG